MPYFFDFGKETIGERIDLNLCAPRIIFSSFPPLSTLLVSLLGMAASSRSLPFRSRICPSSAVFDCLSAPAFRCVGYVNFHLQLRSRNRNSPCPAT